MSQEPTVEIPEEEYEGLKRVRREKRMEEALDDRTEDVKELLDADSIEADASDVEVEL